MKKRMNFTVDEKISEEFRDRVNKGGHKMSFLIELFMRKFSEYDEELDIILFGEEDAE